MSNGFVVLAVVASALYWRMGCSIATEWRDNLLALSEKADGRDGRR